MTVNGLAGEIDWRETDVGLVARLGLKIIRSEVVADSVAERLRDPGPSPGAASEHDDSSGLLSLLHLRCWASTQVRNG
jgi:hypothetical protein